MIEAVGWEWFDAYFRRCSRLLKPDGLFFLQAIVIDDAIYETEKRTRSFANQLIFPGGCLPSVEAIQSSIASADGPADDLRSRTSRPATSAPCTSGATASSPPPTSSTRSATTSRFRRLWRLYMAISEAGFAVARIRDVQMLFAKPGHERSLAPTAGRREAVGLA